MPRRHSRSPARYSSLPQKRRAQSPEYLPRQRSPPSLLRESNTGRFPSPGSSRHRFVREDYSGRPFPGDRRNAPRHTSRYSFEHGSVHEDVFRQHSPTSGRNPERPSHSPSVTHSPEHRNRSFARRITFNGLKDVPLGPRVGAATFDPPTVESAPHIFISSTKLPTWVNAKHLNGLLGNIKPNEIHIDPQHGWYLVYEDSDWGREKLHTCYRRFHNELLFDEHQLAMECSVDGAQANPLRGRHALDRRESDSTIRLATQGQGAASTSPSRRRVGDVNATKPDTLNSHASSRVSSASDWRHERVDSTRILDDGARILQFNQLAPPKHAQLLPPSEAVGAQLSLRSDHDDSASLLSGRTTSDGSRSKRRKCHVCAADGVHGMSSLVHCATCPRKYHKRCHKEPPIPSDLLEGHNWSCRSCVKKGIVSKEGKQGDISLPASSIGLASSQDRPTQQRPSPVVAAVDGQSDSNASPTIAVQRPNTLSNTANNQNPLNRVLRQTAEDSGVQSGSTKGDVSPLSDADNLVERSFASAEKKRSAQSQSSGSSKFKMTRVKLPTAATNTPCEKDSERKSEQSPVNERSLPTDDAMIKDVEEPMVRPSAATLRGLAQARHLATKPYGIQFGLSGQEYRPSDPSLSDIGGLNASSKPDTHVDDRPQAGKLTAETSEAAAAAVTSRAPVQLEIPESPEDVRKGEARGMLKAQDPRGLEDQRPTIDSLESEGETNTPTDESPRRTSGQQSTQRLAKRSRRPAFFICSGCKKKTPAGPSGKNKLCTLCKRKEFDENPSSMANCSAAGIEATNGTLQTSGEIATSAANHEPLLSGSVSGAPLENSFSATSAPAESNNDRGQTLQVNHQHATAQANPTIIDKDGDVDMASTEPSQRNMVTGSDGAPFSNPDTTEDQRRALRGNKDPAHNLDSQHSVSDIAQSGQSDVAVLLDKNKKIEALLGNSFERPKGSRAILVGMALCSAPNNRLQAKSITDWIGNNIPTYTHNQGNWYARIVSQLSQGRVTDTGHGLRYWRDGGWDPGEEGTPTLRWYELLPEIEDMMWKWCPVLKEPLAPKQQNGSKGAKTKDGKKKRRTSQPPASKKVLSRTETLDLMNGVKECAETVKRRESNDFTMETDASRNTMEDAGFENLGASHDASGFNVEASTSKQDTVSSDDQPLSRRFPRPRAMSANTAEHYLVQLETPVNTEMEELPDAEGGASAFLAAAHAEGITDESRLGNPSAPDQPQRPGLVKLPVPSLRVSQVQDANCVSNLGSFDQTSSSPVLKKSATFDVADIEYSVASFLDEWSDYPIGIPIEHNQPKRLRKKLTRKQIFGMGVSQTRLRQEETIPCSPIIPNAMSPAKRSRPLRDTAMNDPYPWENPDAYATRKECKTLEEFFDIPANMIPIISDGQLAYRDGTRTDDGRLPRAREVFKP